MPGGERRCGGVDEGCEERTGGEAKRVREVKKFGVSGVKDNEGEGGREEC